MPLAQVREALGIPGMDVETARNVRDKSRMKTVLRAAGVPCARHRLVTDAGRGAGASPREVGFPLVAKPPAGAGAQATYRLDDPSALRELARPRSRRGPTRPACWRSSWSARSTRSTASRSAGRPSGRPSRTTCRRRWRCCATRGSSGRCCCPRELDDPRYAAISEVGPAALRALGVRDALTPHGVVPPPGRLGRGVRGGRPPARRADLLDARLRARRRLLPGVGRAGDPRPVRPAGAQLRRRHGLPARPGPRPGARGARGRGAAAPARAPGRRGQAAASPASRRRRATRARAT